MKKDPEQSKRPRHAQITWCAVPNLRWSPIFLWVPPRFLVHILQSLLHSSCAPQGRTFAGPSSHRFRILWRAFSKVRSLASFPLNNSPVRVRLSLRRTSAFSIGSGEAPCLSSTLCCASAPETPHAAALTAFAAARAAHSSCSIPVILSAASRFFSTVSRPPTRVLQALVIYEVLLWCPFSCLAGLSLYGDINVEMGMAKLTLE